MKVAVTGAGGRLGSALVAALAVGTADAPGATPGATRAGGIGPGSPLRGAIVERWSRPALDLDRPETLAGLVRERRPDLVIHAAAWTDVDGCARDPETAMRRNGEATAALARASREAGADLVYVSTNEVFDGRRTDGRPYAETDTPGPANPYGRSKRAGEEAVLAAYAPAAAGPEPGSPGASQSPAASGSPGGDARAVARAPRAWIVRTAWLYGPPGADFPAKIVAAAERAVDEPLRLVADEIGSPTRAADLAEAILALVAAAPESGVYHLVNGGGASRAEWAEAVLDGIGLAVPTEHVPGSTWRRASNPPGWGVLGTDRAASLGIRLRGWRAALDDELPRYRALADAGSGSGGSSG